MQEENEEITTIKIKKSVVEKLKQKGKMGDSYNDVIEQLLEESK